MICQQKAFSSYGLPKHYIEVVSNFYEEAKIVLGEKMLMFVLTGSCALGQCIDGFSDIDILIIVEKLDFSDLKCIQGKVAAHNISIAVEILSRNELMRGMLDGKTRLVFYWIDRGLVVPNYIKDGSSLIMPKIDLKQIQKDDELMLPWQLDRLRRLLYGPSDNKRMMIKHLYTILKMRLYSPGHEIITTSYADTFKEFAREFGEEDFDIMTEIFSGSISEGFVKYARRVTERICNGEI